MTAAPAFAVVEVEGFVAVDARGLLVVATNIKKEKNETSQKCKKKNPITLT